MFNQKRDVKFNELFFDELYLRVRVILLVGGSKTEPWGKFSLNLPSKTLTIPHNCFSMATTYPEGKKKLVHVNSVASR